MEPKTLMVSAKADSNIEPPPEGLHLAACVGIYDVGTIYSDRFDVARRKCVLMFELPELPPLEMERDGQRVKLPRCLSRRFTLSLNEKAALRGFLEAWRGKRFTEAELGGFDIAKCLAIGAQVQVMHAPGTEGRTFANLSNALPAPKGVKVTPQTPPTLFSIANLTEPKLPTGLPEWLGKLVMESKEWDRLVARSKAPASAPKPASLPPAATAAPAEAAPSSDDDVPF